jgi:release factor glutamine methyltransferase
MRWQTWPSSWGEAVSGAAQVLAEADVESARLDAQLLLCHLLGASRAALLAAPETPLTEAQGEAYARLVERRGAGEPLAYITGTRDWLDMTLAVDRRVLIPRPETELLAERAIAWATANGAQLAVDVGTGTGALAIALARHVPALHRVIAIDASAGALDVARANCCSLGVEHRVDLRLGSLLDPLLPAEQPDLVVANLPYIPAAELPGLPREVRDHEPRQALDGGPHGGELIMRLLEEATGRLRPPAALFLEIHHEQGARVAAEACRLWPGARVAVHRDYSGWDRIVEVAVPADGAEITRGD